MRSRAVIHLVFCSTLALATACGDDGNSGTPDAAAPDAASGDAAAPVDGPADGVPDAATPDAPSDPGPDATPAAPVLVLSATAVTADEGEPAGATFTVALSEAPDRTVTVSIASSDETVAVVDQATLVFSADDYDLGQVVRVTAVDDADVAGESATITLSAPDLPEATVAVTVVDDDAVSIIADPTATFVSEGGTRPFTVRLSARPGADVTVGISSSDPGAASVNPAELTFTPVDYDQPQTVTITGVEDDDEASEAVTLTLSAGGLTDATIGLAVTDDDTDPPFTGDMFVRGSFNAFGTANPFDFEGGVRYTARISLQTGTHELEISNASFDDALTFSVRADREERIELGASTTLQNAIGPDNNTLLEIDQAGVYLFEMLANDPTAPVLTVSRDPTLRARGK